MLYCTLNNTTGTHYWVGNLSQCPIHNSKIWLNSRSKIRSDRVNWSPSQLFPPSQLVPQSTIPGVSWFPSQLVSHLTCPSGQLLLTGVGAKDAYASKNRSKFVCFNSKLVAQYMPKIVLIKMFHYTSTPKEWCLHKSTCVPFIVCSLYV